MRRLLNKSIDRELSILEFLIANGYSVKAEDLVSHLNISFQTLKSDINQLLKKFDQIDIFYSRNQVSLLMKDNVDINYFYKNILEKDYGFNLLERAFFDKNLTITHLANENHTSESTIYRAVNRLNEVLKERYKIEISTNPLVILGDEIDIRCFYSQYFLSRYDDYSWIYNRETEKVLDNFLTSLFREVGYTLDFGFFKSLKTTVSVNLYRYKRGYILKNKMPVKEDIVSDIVGKLPRNVVKNFEDTFLIGTKSVDLKQLFGELVHPAIIYDPKKVDQILKDFEEGNKWEYSDTLVQLNQLVGQLVDKYKISIPDKSFLLLQLHNTFYLRNSETHVTYLLADRKKQFLDGFSSQFPNFTEDAVDLMAEFINHFCDQPALETEYIHHMVYNLIVNWSGLSSQLEDLKAPVSILITSDIDLNHARSIQDLIHHNFSTIVNTSLYEEIYFDWDKINSSDYDLVITTFQCQPFTDKHLLNVSDFPNILVLHQLHKYISDIRMEKSHNGKLKLEEKPNCDE